MNNEKELAELMKLIEEIRESINSLTSLKIMKILRENKKILYHAQYVLHSMNGILSEILKNSEASNNSNAKIAQFISECIHENECI